MTDSSQQADLTVNAGAETSMADVFWPEDANSVKQAAHTSSKASDQVIPSQLDGQALQHDETGFEPFALPDGIDIDVDLLNAFRPAAAELGITQDQAQALVNFYAAQVEGLAGRMGEAAQFAQSEVMDKDRAEWIKSSRSDSEIGGVRHQQAVSVAQGALRSLGTPELVSVLAETGLGDHPEIIRLFYRIGTKIGEDPLMTGGGGHAPTSLADLFYGSSN